eukprot:gene47888-16379_t
MLLIGVQCAGAARATRPQSTDQLDEMINGATELRLLF